MSILLRTALILISLLTLLAMDKKIRKSKLHIEYAIFWFLFILLLIVLAVFPQIGIAVSKILQFQATENMIFLAVIFILMVKMFFQTVEISQLEYRVEELAQKIALDEQERKQAQKEEA